jgi:hypothetical protein
MTCEMRLDGFIHICQIGLAYKGAWNNTLLAITGAAKPT